MADAIQFFVAGVAAPGGSKKAFVIPGTGRAVVVEDAKGNASWRERVASCASRTMAGSVPLDGALYLDVVFLMPRPKSHFRTGRRAAELRPSAPLFHVIRPDATKLLRALEDSLKGICWRDDSQVAKQSVLKVYGTRPGAMVKIRRMADRKDA